MRPPCGRTGRRRSDPTIRARWRRRRAATKAGPRSGSVPRRAARADHVRRKRGGRGGVEGPLLPLRRRAGGLGRDRVGDRDPGARDVPALAQRRPGCDGDQRRADPVRDGQRRHHRLSSAPLSSCAHNRFMGTEEQSSNGGGVATAAETLSITDNRTGQTYEVPIEDGTVRAMALRDIKVSDDDFGLMTYDPAYTNTASCRSAITCIDGDKGILEYRGYPIEQLAEESTYLEVA